MTVTPGMSTKVSTGLVSQLSVAVAKPVLVGESESVQASVRSGGQMMTGAIGSTTVTFCVQVRVRLVRSVAVQTTNVMPTGKTDGALLVIVTGPQLSLAVAEPRTTPVAKQVPGAVLVSTSDGQVSNGGVVSRTVTVNEQLLLLPAASLAVQLTVVTPGGKSEPLAGRHVTVGLGSQLSLATGANMTRFPAMLVHSTVRFVQARVGAVWSVTVMVAVQVLLLPAASLAARVTTVAPSPITVPATGFWVTVTALQASLAATCGTRFGSRAVQAAPAAMV